MAEEVLTHLAPFNERVARVATRYEEKGSAYKCLGGNATITLGPETISDTAAILRTYIAVTEAMHQNIIVQARELHVAKMLYDDAEAARKAAQVAVDKANKVMDAMTGAKFLDVFTIWWALRGQRRRKNGRR